MSARLLIGPHISAAKGYRAMARHAEALGASTFGFFTRNPRGGNARAVDEVDEAAFLLLHESMGLGPLVAHAAYTMNPAAGSDSLFDFTCRAMAEDIARLSRIPGVLYNLHPGSHGGSGPEFGVARVAEALNAVLGAETPTVILLETMTGRGNEMGGRFEELAEIMHRVMHAESVGVCMDLCHCWEAGYDVRGDLDGVLAEFDRIIGLHRLRAVHLNDSLNERGARKDRHARIGEGQIGQEALIRAVRHEALRSLPFILETPNDDEGWTREITMLREAVEQ